jgi:hypothetical protein
MTPPQSTHRVETTAFCRTFHHDGKIALVRVGGAHPPLFTIVTITSKVEVYAPAEWADGHPHKVPHRTVILMSKRYSGPLGEKQGNFALS